MRVVIEFFRIRAGDDAHAVVGREAVEAADLDAAIRLAARLSHSLEMPQRPDGLSILDLEGRRLYTGALSAETA